MELKKYSDPKIYPGFNELKTHFPFFIDQIIKEKEISETVKHECLESICTTIIIDKNDLERKCCDYFDKKKLIGTICKNSQLNNSYLRVNGKSSLVTWIGQIVGLSTSQVIRLLSPILYSSNSIIKNGLTNKLLSLEAINDSYFIKENCIKYFGISKWKARKKPTLRDAFLTNFNYIQWSSPNPKTENLFENQTTIDLIPCRAGLVFKGEQIIFLHNLSDSYNVRKPTIFDARLYSQFEPGGYTKPLANCDALNGFDEFVHIPNNFRNIVSFQAETFYK